MVIFQKQYSQLATRHGSMMPTGDICLFRGRKAYGGLYSLYRGMAALWNKGQGLYAQTKRGIFPHGVFAILAFCGLAFCYLSLPSQGLCQDLPSSQKNPGLKVEVGVSKGLSQMIWHGAGLTSHHMDGSKLFLDFATRQLPSLTRLHIDPPPYLQDAKAELIKDHVTVTLTLAANVSAKVLTSDGGHIINLTASDKTQLDNSAQEDSLFGLSMDLEKGRLALHFIGQKPVAAAVFRRGDGVWILFDRAIHLDSQKIPLATNTDGRSPVRYVLNLKGQDYSALRLSTAKDLPIAVHAKNKEWTIVLGRDSQSSVQDKTSSLKGSTVAEGQQPDPEAMATKVQASTDGSGVFVLSTLMSGLGKLFLIKDPIVGDNLGIAPALAPVKTMAMGHSFIGGSLIPSFQGLAVSTMADNVAVTASQDQLKIRISLNPPPTPVSDRNLNVTRSTDIPSILEPGMIEAGDGRSPDNFSEQFSNLFTKVGLEMETGSSSAIQTKSGQARLALARFLIRSDLSFEAIGILNLLEKTNRSAANSAEFHGLRGMAKAMAGRYKAAMEELASPNLAYYRAIALWRGYAAVKLGDLALAHQEFTTGRLVLKDFHGLWRSRLARAAAEADLAAQDELSAHQDLDTALGSELSDKDKSDQDEKDANQFLKARLLELDSRPGDALRLYASLSQTSYGFVRVSASLKTLQMHFAHNDISVDQAIKTLNDLRYDWTGDGIEISVSKILSHFYVLQGNYRDAMNVLKLANNRHIRDPAVAMSIQVDLENMFRDLFLKGGVDGLPPIQALGLFYDFRDLTPLGSDGDLVVRQLSARLVDVDLLPQAAELLAYQVDQRLEGLAKAEVATDLADIYLMNHDPEKALQAINDSRTTLLPDWLNNRRRLTEVRALIALGRTDHALEVLDKMTSPEALVLRAEAAWHDKNWTKAAQNLEARLGGVWKSEKSLSKLDEDLLLRAAIAYNLGNNPKDLARLKTHFGHLAAMADAKESLSLVLSDSQTENMTPTNLIKMAAGVDSFITWASETKKRFLESLKHPAMTQAFVGDPRKKG